MKSLLITLSLVTITFAVKAQKTDTLKGLAADTVIFYKAQKDPSFPGGPHKFGRFLQNNIHYPADSHKKNIQGTVILTMIVEKDGQLTHFKVIKSVAEDIDAEALRVMKLSPNWIPGTLNGKPVRVSYTVPISFSQQQ